MASYKCQRSSKVVNFSTDGGMASAVVAVPNLFFTSFSDTVPIHSFNSPIPFDEREAVLASMRSVTTCVCVFDFVTGIRRG